MKFRRKWKWLGDYYDDFSEAQERKENIKLQFWFLLIVFFPLMMLMFIRYILGFGINLVD